MKNKNYWRITIISVMVLFLGLTISACNPDPGSNPASGRSTTTFDPGTGDTEVTGFVDWETRNVPMPMAVDTDADGNPIPLSGGNNNVTPLALNPPIDPLDVWGYGSWVNRLDNFLMESWTGFVDLVTFVLEVSRLTQKDMFYTSGYQNGYLRADGQNFQATGMPAPVSITAYISQSMSGADPAVTPWIFDDAPLACWYFGEDNQNGVFTPNIWSLENYPDPAVNTLCPEELRAEMFMYTGTDLPGNTTYRPGTYDDPRLPFDGSETVWIQSSLLPGGWYQLTWDPTANGGIGAFTAVFPSVLSGQRFWIGTFRPDTSGIPGITIPEPAKGGNWMVPIDGSGTPLGAWSLLVNYLDTAYNTATIWPGAVIEGFNTTTYLLIQGPDTRGDVLVNN